MEHGDEDRNPARQVPRPGPFARRAMDAGLRLGLGGLWIVVAIWGDPTALGLPGEAVWALRSGLAAGGALLLAGWASRPVAALGSLLAWVLAPAAWKLPVGAALGIGVAGRLALATGRGGGWLRRVQALEGERARTLLATELARARARRAGAGAERTRALSGAGDAYERAGRLRQSLVAMGARPARTTGLVRPAGFVLGELLAPLPAARAALERRLRRERVALGAERREAPGEPC